MGRNPKIDEELHSKLSSYKVTVPEFSMKRNRWDRFIIYLASPAKNPFERFAASLRGITVMGFLPIVGALIISLLQLVVLL